MSNSIRELTEKIYSEAIVKANTEAEKIISDARKKADEIIEAARIEKEIIVSKANKETEEVKRKADSELGLAAQKLISNLKQKVTDTLVSKQVNTLATEAFADDNFVKEMLLQVIKTWTERNQDESDLSLLIPKSEEKKIAAYFDGKLIAQLQKGIEIKVDPGIKNGFKIGPKGGNYIISFTENDFENYFKAYLKEKTWKLIFDE